MYDPIPSPPINMANLILATDSYKLNHWNQYPSDTEAVYSYFESRHGAKYPYTVFFGLQAILDEFLTTRITWDDLDMARKLAPKHFRNDKRLNDDAWERIITKHGGLLPIRIKAVPEGTPVPTGNVLMTVENCAPEYFYLTNAVESLLTHVWYPSTVATLSREVKIMERNFLVESSDNGLDGLPFMLHDFGYRGATTHDAAAIGGAAHLVNFVGSDTVPAMLLAMKHYDADLDTLAFSVPATEHSIMTSLGENGEFDIVDQLLNEYPDGILSVVADSYDIYRFVKQVGSTFKERIMERDGVFVVRPDSITHEHQTPEDLVVWIADQLWRDFGGKPNSKGYKVLDPHVRILWGDGIDPEGIRRILEALALHSYSAEIMATFGMGGGLLQKVNRDTQRFAFKSSAQERNGVWHDIYKKPLDESKASKRGRLALIQQNGEFQTVQISELSQGRCPYDCLETVFENGEITKRYTFDEVRANAAV